MSLLDSVLGGLMGNSPNAGPLQSVLGSLLGGGSQAAGAGQQQPGLTGLVNSFQQAGLGNIIGSWIGNGPNQQIAPQQLQQVFGQNQINQWSQQTGLQPQSILSELSNLLPHAVDRMTPNGEIPSLAGPGAAMEASPFDGAGTELPPGR